MRSESSQEAPPLVRGGWSSWASVLMDVAAVLAVLLFATQILKLVSPSRAREESAALHCHRLSADQAAGRSDGLDRRPQQLAAFERCLERPSGRAAP